MPIQDSPYMLHAHRLHPIRRIAWSGAISFENMVQYCTATQWETHSPMPKLPIDGRQRVIVARVSPEIDCGRFAIKRVVGETVIVDADVFADGHDLVACQILYSQDGYELQSSPMNPI